MTPDQQEWWRMMAQRRAIKKPRSIRRPLLVFIGSILAAAAVCIGFNSELNGARADEMNRVIIMLAAIGLITGITAISSSREPK